MLNVTGYTFSAEILDNKMKLIYKATFTSQKDTLPPLAYKSMLKESNGTLTKPLF